MKNALPQTYHLADDAGFRYSRGRNDVTPPSTAPLITQIATGETTSRILFTPAADGESGVSYHIARIRRNGTVNWLQEITVPYVGVNEASTTCLFEGLAAGTSYDHEVEGYDGGTPPNSRKSAIRTAPTAGSAVDLAPGTIAIRTAAVSLNESAPLQIEVTHTGAGASSPIVEADWQFTGFSEGTPSPANGTLQWAPGDNSPKVIQSTAGIVSADRTGTFRVAVVRALSGVIQPTLGVSTVGVTIRNLVGTGIKLNPGHYINISDNNNTAYPSNSLIDEIAAVKTASGGDVQGIFLAIMWGQLNTGNGVYNWTQLDNVIAYCASKGLRLILRVSDRSFGINVSSQYVVPGDMMGNPAYGGGYFTKTGTASGRMAKLWNAAVHARWMLFVQDLAAKYDGVANFEAFKGSETSTGIDGNSPPTEDRWQSLYNDSVRDFVRKAPAKWPHTAVIVGANYGEDTFIESLHADCLTYRCATGGPDVVPTFAGANPAHTPAHNPTDADRVYLGQHWGGSSTGWVAGGTDFRGRILKCNEIQGPEMGGKEGSWTCAQFYDYAKNTLRQNYLVWSRKENSYLAPAYPAQDLYWNNANGHPDGLVPDVKTFLSAGGHPMVTTAPAYYASAPPITLLGGTLTITHNSLGSGSVPLKYDEFETYTTGSTLVSNGYLALNGAGPQANSVTVSTDWARQGTKSSKCVFPSQGASVNEWFPEVGIALPAGCTYRYSSFWERWTRVSGSTDHRLWKHVRGGANPPYSGSPRFNVTRGAGTPALSLPISDSAWTAENGSEGRAANGPQLPADTDNFVEIFYKLSNPAGAANGHFILLANGVVQINLTGITRVNAASEIDYDFLQVGMDYYANTVFASYRDLYYVHASYKRIVGTNNATYASSTNWVLQKATSWAFNTFSGAFQRGNFPSGSTMHLWGFVDEANPLAGTYLGAVTVP